jgi:hypothetical protein
MWDDSATDRTSHHSRRPRDLGFFGTVRRTREWATDGRWLASVNKWELLVFLQYRSPRTPRLLAISALLQTALAKALSRCYPLLGLFKLCAQFSVKKKKKLFLWFSHTVVERRLCVCVLILVICFQEPSLSGFQKALARRNGLQD